MLYPISPVILHSAVGNPIYRFLGYGRLALQWPTLNEIASIFVYLPLCFCHLALIYDVIRRNHTKAKQIWPTGCLPPEVCEALTRLTHFQHERMKVKKVVDPQTAHGPYFLCLLTNFGSVQFTFSCVNCRKRTCPATFCLLFAGRSKAFWRVVNLGYLSSSTGAGFQVNCFQTYYDSG